MRLDFSSNKCREILCLACLVTLLLPVVGVGANPWSQWQDFRDRVIRAEGCVVRCQVSGDEIPDATLEIRFCAPDRFSLDAFTDRSSITFISRGTDRRLLLGGDAVEMIVPDFVEDASRFGRIPKDLLEWDARVSSRLRAGVLKNSTDGFTLDFRQNGRDEWKFGSDGELLLMRHLAKSGREELRVQHVTVEYLRPELAAFRRRGRNLSPLFSGK